MSNLKKNPTPNLMETLFILSMSIFILILLFWIACQFLGRDQFQVLPDWLTALGGNIWGFLTAGGTSGLLYLWLKQTMKKKERQSPNYLFWILSMTVIFFIGVFCIILIGPSSRGIGQPSDQLLLRFGFKYSNCPKSLTVAYVSPFKESENIVLQPDNLFKLTFYNAKPFSRFMALMGPTQFDGTFSNKPITDKITLCFDRTSYRLPEKSPPSVLLECNQEKEFSILSGGELVEICNKDAPVDATLNSNFITMAYASQEDIKESVSPGWIVPSLESLNSYKKDGFTQFSIELKKEQGVEKADRAVFSVFINGTPIYIDGFEPKYLAKKITTIEAINYKFGLQNLGFAGADKGYENIEVVVQFMQGDNLIKQIKYPFKYVAIRSFDRRFATTLEGHPFYWEASYIKAKETDYEVFIASSHNPNLAEDIKQKVDSGAYTYSTNQKIVAVVRPPLGTNKNYGVVVGLEYDTGQIRFTFKKDEAEELCSWVKQMNSVNMVFPKDAYLYRIKG